MTELEVWRLWDYLVGVEEADAPETRPRLATADQAYHTAMDTVEDHR